jgi:nucleoid-associated protein YgaU
MAVRLRKTSRLLFAKLLSIDDVEHWELPVYPKIEEATDDKRYTVDQNDRIDKIANKFYGSPELWWIIALANGMELLPSDLNANAVIRIPSQRRVFTQILRRPSRGREGR